MKVEFASNELRRNYLSRSDGAREWGAPVGAKYIRAISVLANAAGIRDVSAVRNLRLHQLRANAPGSGRSIFMVAGGYASH